MQIEQAVPALNRRDFLRLCVITAGGAILTACQQTLTEIAATSTGEPSLKLSVGGDRDVWAWTEHVKVAVSGNCPELSLRVNEQPVDVRPDGNQFLAEVPLAEGANQLEATCLEPGVGEVRSERVTLTGRLRDVPRAVIDIKLETDGILLDGSASEPAQSGASLREYRWSARAENPAPLEAQGGAFEGSASSPSIVLVPPGTDGEYYVTLHVKDEAGREDSSTTYFVIEGGQARIPDYDREHPSWVETAIVYGAVPFLFGSPAFQALRGHLAELADLGINVLWLGPINKHPPDDYGYAVEDYFALDPAYGSDEDFRELVQAAHARGIRVLMDFVPNHTSNTHPYFLDAQARGTESPYWDFYDRDEHGNYTYYFDWQHLPNLNYDNPEVRRMIVEAFTYWVREFDVDGFRVDVVWGVAERQPDFWLAWRRELKRVKPDVMLLAEATARDPYYFENGFDVAYDWTERPGGWAWDIVWNSYKFRLIGYNLTTALTNRPEGYHPDAVVFRFLNNNDTSARFITRHGEGPNRVATALLLTLPGIPLIYTGDEYGLEFQPYQQVEPLTFEERVPGLREYHKRLIALRKTVPSLHSRLWEPIQTDPIPQNVFGYVRFTEAADQGAAPVIVLLNFSEEPAEFQFDVPEQFGAVSAPLYDLLAEEAVPATEGNRLRVSVPGFTARVLAKEPAA